VQTCASKRIDYASGMRTPPLLALVALILSTPAAAQEAPLPHWLAGTWIMQDGSAWAEELWTDGKGAMMLGIGRTGFGPDIENWEVARIERRKGSGAVVMTVQPKGGKPVEFPMTVTSDDAVEFANPANSFPQRIRYWRQGQLLMAEISALDGSNAMRWNYRPVAP